MAKKNLPLWKASKVNPFPDDIEMPSAAAVLPVRKNIMPTDIPTQGFAVPAEGPSGDNPVPVGAANTKNVAGAGVSSRVGPSEGQSMYPGQGK